MIEDPAAVEGISDDITNFLKIIRDNLIDVIDDILPDGSGDIFNENGFVICDGICMALTSLGPFDADFTCGCTCLAGSLGLGLTSLPVQALCLGAGPILDCDTDIGDEIDELIINTIIKLVSIDVGHAPFFCFVPLHGNHSHPTPPFSPPLSPIAACAISLMPIFCMRELSPRPGAASVQRKVRSCLGHVS